MTNAMTDGYIELNARSAFSFLEGASLPEDLIAAAGNFGMPAMALIDRDGVYGAPRFHMAAKKAGIRAHIGAEISCVDGWPSLSAACRVSGWISEFVPADHTHEAAREEGRRRGYL